MNNASRQRKKKTQEKPLGKKESVPKGVLTSVKSQEVNFLVSSPSLASGSSLRENIQDFESLSETLRFTGVCEDAFFVHLVSAGMSYKTRLDEDYGFGQIIPLCTQIIPMTSTSCISSHSGRLNNCRTFEKTFSKWVTLNISKL